MPSNEEIIRQCKNLAAEGANEAETRRKIIDDIIYSVLGWHHPDISYEERVEEDSRQSYADYIIRTAMTGVVIEAKRVGTDLAKLPSSRRVNLRGRIMEGAHGKAIKQARDYARKKSIAFSVVTDGNAWIIFPATRIDQVSFENSSALIFPSIESALRDDLAEFTDALSRDSVVSGALENLLLGKVENQIEDRRLNRTWDTSFSKINRHNMFPLIEGAVSTAFSEEAVTQDSDLLEKCYVTTADRTRFDKRIGMHIAARNKVTKSASVRPMRDSASQAAQLFSKTLAASKPLAILVLGQVGSGKTTYITYLRNVTLSLQFEPRQDKAYPHWIYLDFRQFVDGEDVLSFVISRIKQYIDQDPFFSAYDRCIRHAYREKFDALFKGPLFLLAQDEQEKKRRITELLMSDYAEGLPYIDTLFSYAVQHTRIFLVVDNVDQFESVEQQNQIFSVAMSLAQKIGLSLVCAMRESTFVRSRHFPIFDAFDFDTIVIDPPAIEAVLSKRFAVAKQILAGESGTFIAENGIPFQVDNVVDIIDLVQGSVLGTEIGRTIEVLSTGDVRLALRMTREFLRSGWTQSGQALAKFQGTGRYLMPQHEAFRALIVGNQQVYMEQFSVLANIFDARVSRTQAQMLRLYILNAAVLGSSDRYSVGIEGGVIRDIIRTLGFGEQIIQVVLSDLCKARFLLTASHGTPSFDSNFVVTRLGGYVIRDFLANFVYLENTMIDTFVSDLDTWNQLKESTRKIYAERDTVRKIELRISRVRCFFDFLSTSYSPLLDESARRGFASQWCGSPLEGARNTLVTTLDGVASSANRNYG